MCEGAVSHTTKHKSVIYTHGCAVGAVGVRVTYCRAGRGIALRLSCSRQTCTCRSEGADGLSACMVCRLARRPVLTDFRRRHSLMLYQALCTHAIAIGLDLQSGGKSLTKLLHHRGELSRHAAIGGRNEGCSIRDR